jgi:hypothetical protein
MILDPAGIAGTASPTFSASRDLVSITKQQIELTSLEAWEYLAGPKSPDHWTDDRSAKVVARARLEGKGVNLHYMTAFESAWLTAIEQIAAPQVAYPAQSPNNHPHVQDCRLPIHFTERGNGRKRRKRPVCHVEGHQPGVGQKY